MNNQLKFIKISKYKNNKIISTALYNINYITDIIFLKNEGKIMIEFSQEASGATISINLKILNETDKENFDKFITSFTSLLNNSNLIISLSELFKINNLTIVED